MGSKPQSPVVVSSPPRAVAGIRCAVARAASGNLLRSLTQESVPTAALELLSSQSIAGQGQCGHRYKIKYSRLLLERAWSLIS